MKCLVLHDADDGQMVMTTKKKIGFQKVVVQHSIKVTFDCHPVILCTEVTQLFVQFIQSDKDMTRI